METLLNQNVLLLLQSGTSDIAIKATRFITKETQSRKGLFYEKLLNIPQAVACDAILISKRADPNHSPALPLVPMINLQIDGYATCVVMGALQEADLKWDRLIADAEAGFHAPSFDVEGAKLCRDDLRAVIEQLRQKA